MQTLMSHESAVGSIQERHLSLEGSITQRLKWAAGANPSLNQVVQQFEEALSARNILIQVTTFLYRSQHSQTGNNILRQVTFSDR